LQNQQEMRIVHLEKELAACPRRDALDAFHASQEQRAAGLQLHAERLGETVARTDGALRALAERVSLLERKAQQREQLLEDERAGLQRFREEVLDVVQQKLDMRKWLFTTSHEQTLAELRAVQGLLAQKVDRAEVPAIKAAASRVHEALEMRDRVEQELRRLSSEVLTLRHAVNEKESKDATLQRMQTLHKMISAKVDQAWLQTHVVDRLEAVRSKSLPVRVQERQERQEARLEQLESALRVVMESTQRLSDHSEQLYREVKAVGEARKVADQHVLAVKVRACVRVCACLCADRLLGRAHTSPQLTRPLPSLLAAAKRRGTLAAGGKCQGQHCLHHRPAAAVRRAQGVSGSAYDARAFRLRRAATPPRASPSSLCDAASRCRSTASSSWRSSSSTGSPRRANSYRARSCSIASVH
jgi:adenylate kinase family enzyme